MLGRGNDRLLENGLQEGVDAFAAHALLDNLSVRVEQEQVRDGRHAEFPGEGDGRIQQLRVVDAHIGHRLLRIGLLVPDSDAQDDQAFILIVVVRFHHVRGLFAAGAAPRGPEIDQDILALAHEIVQAARGLGDGPIGLQLDEGTLGRPRGGGITGGREHQAGDEEDSGE